MNLCNLGDRPLLSKSLPRKHGFTVHRNRFDQAEDAWQRKIIDTSDVVPLNMLSYLMAS